MTTQATASQYPDLSTAGWSHPITFNVYNVDKSGTNPALGTRIASVTQTVAMPWRPAADPTCKNSDGISHPEYWRADATHCYKHLAFNITLDLSSIGTVPDEIIYGIAYNTQAYGASPIGSGGPFNSLNVGTNTVNPTIEGDVEPDAVFFSSITKDWYADKGAAGVGTFRRDTNWAGWVPAVSLSVTTPTPPAPAVTAPGVPTAVESTGGDKSANVSWTAPASNGGSVMTGYTVTSAPDGKTATTTGGLSATVNGLTNGTAYTFTVTATNATGTSMASLASAAVTPLATTVPAVPVSGPTADVTKLSDFNKDGRTDLVARESSGKLWLYPGNGAGSFLPRRQMGTGWSGMAAIVTPGDVTGDGNADIIAKDSLGRLWLYAGNAASGLSARRQIGSGWKTYTITSGANMNGTGRPDLLARDSAGRLWVYPLSGNAVIGARTKVGTGWNGYLITGAGDVSGDKRADILARDSAGSLWLYRGTGTGHVTGRTLVSTGMQAMTAMVSPGNWNGKVGNDLLTRDAAGRMWFREGDNAGRVGVPRQIGSRWQGMTFIG